MKLIDSVPNNQNKTAFFSEMCALGNRLISEIDFEQIFQSAEESQLLNSPGLQDCLKRINHVFLRVFYQKPSVLSSAQPLECLNICLSLLILR